MLKVTNLRSVMIELTCDACKRSVVSEEAGEGTCECGREYKTDGKFPRMEFRPVVRNGRKK